MLGHDFASNDHLRRGLMADLTSHPIKLDYNIIYMVVFLPIIYRNLLLALIGCSEDVDLVTRNS